MLLGGLLFDVTGRTVSFLVIAAIGLVGLPAALALLKSGHAAVVGRASASDGAGNELTHADPTQSPAAPQEREKNPLQVQGPDHSSSATALSSVDPGGPATLSEKVWDLLISKAPELSFRQRRMILTANFTFFCFHLVMNGVLISSLGYFLNLRLGAGAAIAGIVIGIATLNGLLISTRWISGLSAPYFGHIGDKYGRARILAVSIPICLFALLLLAFSPSLWLIVAWLPVAFAATAASITALDSLVGGLAPERRRAQIMSRYATWQDSGSALGPLIVFAVLEYTTSSFMFVYLGGATLLAFAFVVFLATVRAGKADGIS